MRKMRRLPAQGTKDRMKLDAMTRLGPPRGAEKRELQDIDGNGGWGTYKNDGQRYADFLGGRLRVWGEGKSERYWIELPPNQDNLTFEGKQARWHDNTARTREPKLW